MPYVTKPERDFIDTQRIDSVRFESVGQLTYGIYKLMLRFTVKPRFFVFAYVVGAAVCAVLEFYRRVIAPYEDQKIAENGDVSCFPSPLNQELPETVNRS